MLPIPRADGISCKTCPFFGDEGVAIEVQRGQAHRTPVRGVVLLGTCRVEAPERQTGTVDLSERASHLTGEIRIVGHGWVPEKYWCGRHPKIRCPNECSPPKPKATRIAFGKVSLEPDPATPTPSPVKGS